MKKLLIFLVLIFFGALTFSKVSAETKNLTGSVFANDNWISLNCADENFCAVADYKVVVDENNNLSGYGYSENFGLINFNPERGGVKNNTDNEITGWAFGDKLGWTHFDGAKIVLFDKLEEKVASIENKINLINNNTASISEIELMDLLRQLCKMVFSKSQCAI